MIISRSDISMSADHTRLEKREKTEELRMWVDNQDPRTQDSSDSLNDKISISKDAKNSLSENLKASLEPEAEEGEIIDTKLLLLKSMVEALTGRKINLKDITRTESNPELDEITTELQQAATENQGPDREGWGIIYNSHESYHESENLTVDASGIIKTEDGKEIEFTVTLEMDRNYESHEYVNFRAGDALIDPLVINFSGSAADLTDTKYAFDLDADGREDNISFVSSGRGLLVLDKNYDGIINNGSELFGPTTGNGFNELADYDSDGNNWIDENDFAYNRLNIWTKDADGNDQLHSLKEKNVGAIYLDKIDSEFSIKTDHNELKGQVASTGIYVTEDDKVGTVQQVNLVI